MSAISPHSGHLGPEGYRALVKDTPIEFGSGRTLTFTQADQLTVKSIEDMGKVSFSYQKFGASSKKLSIKIGKKTPLYAQIQKLASKDEGEQKVVIKALVLKYVATLLDAHEIGQDGVKKIQARFDSNNQCITVRAGVNDVSENVKSWKGKSGEKTRSIRSHLTHLSTEGKEKQVFQNVMQVKVPEAESSLPILSEEIRGRVQQLQKGLQVQPLLEQNGRLLSKGFQGKVDLEKQFVGGVQQSNSLNRLEPFASTGESAEGLARDLAKSHPVFNRAMGIMVGLRQGDAGGRFVEFTPPPKEDPKDENRIFNGVRLKEGVCKGGHRNYFKGGSDESCRSDWDGQGAFSVEPGRWTDDTAMSLCLADSLLAHPLKKGQGRDSLVSNLGDRLLRYTLWWFRGYNIGNGNAPGAIGLGGNISAQVHRIQDLWRKHEGGLHIQKDHVQCIGKNRDAGNGVLMRMGPLVTAGWHLEDKELMEVARDESGLTHGGTDSVVASQFFAFLLKRAVFRQSSETRQSFLDRVIREFKGLQLEADLTQQRANFAVLGMPFG